MATLVVGAGATGGYLADRLGAAGRDVTMLVRPATQARLVRSGIRFRDPDGATRVMTVATVTRDRLPATADLVIVAVRSDAVDTAIEDFSPVVGPTTRIVPVGNGVAHLSALRAAFGDHAVVGATVEMATSLGADGVIDVVQPGVRVTVGGLDPSVSIEPVVDALDVDGIDVTVVDDAPAAMWSKFLFIVATATLTCATRGTVAQVASADGGGVLADRVLDEIAAVVAAATGSTPDVSGLRGRLHDVTWGFGPSMYRDLIAGRRVESGVVTEMSDHARAHGLSTPLLDSVGVALAVHNRAIDDRRPAADGHG